MYDYSHLEEEGADYYRVYKLKKYEQPSFDLAAAFAAGFGSNDVEIDEGAAGYIISFLIVLAMAVPQIESAWFREGEGFFHLLSNAWSFFTILFIVCFSGGVFYLLGRVLNMFIVPLAGMFVELYVDAKKGIYKYFYEKEVKLAETVDEARAGIVYTKDTYYYMHYAVSKDQMLTEYYDMDAECWDIIRRIYNNEVCSTKANVICGSNVIPDKSIFANEYMSYDFFIKNGAKIVDLYANQIVWKRWSPRNVVLKYKLENNIIQGFTIAINGTEQSLNDYLEKNTSRLLYKSQNNLFFYELESKS